MVKPIGQHADGSQCWTPNCSLLILKEDRQKLLDFNLAKRCSSCKQVLSLEAFAVNRLRLDGLQSQCKECHRKTNRASYEKGKAVLNSLKYARNAEKVATTKAYLTAYKLAHPCVDCKMAVIETLDFDHREGVEKLFDVSKGVFKKTLIAVQDEVAKCDVRCANCHRIKTYGKSTWRTGNQPDTSTYTRISRNSQLAKQKKRELLLNRFANGCVDCKNKDPRVLEMDHVRGQKLGNISEMIRNGVGMPTFLEELAKCDVRCANCHRIVTRSREREQKA